VRLRHLFTILYLLLLPLSAGAVDVSATKARQAAEAFLVQCGVPQTRSGYLLQLLNYDESAVTRTDVLPSYYIFNLPQGGFVIISGCEAAVPVLGYSLEHSFSLEEGMPESLSEWLACYESQIQDFRASGANASGQQLARWSNLLTQTGTRSAARDSIDLKTPDWGQGSPFNQGCPLDTLSKRSLVGCVPVAFSQLFYFYKYPEKGTGTIPSYTTHGITVPENTLGRTYNYTKMLAKYKGVSYTSAQATAVSNLCFDVANACQASFGSSSTSASTTGSASRICTYFGYDQGIERNTRNYSSAESWKKMLKESIDAGEPVVYYGNNATSGSGHAFLVDGYDSDGKFLINFGWNGSSNGYYELDAFGAYTKSQGCLTGVVPNRGGSPNYKLSLIYNQLSSGTTYNGLTYVSGTISSGNTIKVKTGSIANVSIYAFSGYFRFGVVDKYNNLKYWTKDSVSVTISAGSSKAYPSVSAVLPSGKTISRGDALKAYFRTSDNPDWTQMTYNEDDSRVCGALPLHIADITSLTYVPESKILRIYTVSGATYTLKTSSGTTKSSGTVYGSRAIDVSTYTSGTYTLAITYGGNTYSVKLVL